MECESACLSFTIDLHDPLAYTVYIYIYIYLIICIHVTKVYMLLASDSKVSTIRVNQISSISFSFKATVMSRAASHAMTSPISGTARLVVFVGFFLLKCSRSQHVPFCSLNSWV